MAILSGINTRMQGNVGEWIYSTRNGKVVVSQKPLRKVTRTSAQMQQRMRWRNVMNTWSAFSNKLKPSFETYKMKDFNAFMSANAGKVSVYLPKDIAQQGGAVAAPYCISHGTLQTIYVTGTGNVKQTDIKLGSLVISATTTVAEFSAAVLKFNPDYRRKDQITYYRATQVVDANGVPRIKMSATAVVLSLKNDKPLWNVVDRDGFASVGGYLAAGSTVEGAQAWVHSRKNKAKSKTEVSTQNFVVTNSLLDSYMSKEMLMEAAESYGGIVDEDFLTPKDDDDEEREVDFDYDDDEGDDVGGHGDDGEQGGGATYTLTLSSNGPGSVTPANTPKAYAAGESVTVAATPDAGASFVNWNDGNRSTTRVVVMNADVNLTANFIQASSEE